MVFAVVTLSLAGEGFEFIGLGPLRNTHMPDTFVFADEAGDFTFEKKNGASKHFILCTILAECCDVGHALLELRRKLAWTGAELGEYFHATKDKQAIRDAVFETICKHKFSVQATIMEKTKAQPHVREDRARFYKTGWYFHFKHGAAPIVAANSETLITTATIGTRKEQAAFTKAVDDVMRQTIRAREWRTDFCPAHADPCVQVADYCAWAIQRKWESDEKDCRSYDLIKDRITYERDLWQHGNTHYY